MLLFGFFPPKLLANDKERKLGMVAHTYIPSTLGQVELVANLDNVVSSRLA